MIRGCLVHHFEYARADCFLLVLGDSRLDVLSIGCELSHARLHGRQRLRTCGNRAEKAYGQECCRGFLGRASCECMS